jgi:hypothetical protein
VLVVVRVSFYNLQVNVKGCVCCYMSNSHTMVYTKSLVVDFKLHESIKQVIDYHSVHELYELSVHPFIYAVRGSADGLA